MSFLFVFLVINNYVNDGICVGDLIGSEALMGFKKSKSSALGCFWGDPVFEAYTEFTCKAVCGLFKRFCNIDPYPVFPLGNIAVSSVNVLI